MTRPPILVYGQHLLGLGHVHRATRLVRSLQRAGERVLFVTGGLPVPGLDPGGAEEVALPPLTAGDEAVSQVVRPDGTTPDPAYLAERRNRLLALVSARNPAVVLLDLFPFGRHGLAFELAPLLLALSDERARRGPGAPRVVVSLRDIVVTKKNPAWSELTVLAVVRQWVDRVLVHGSPDVIPLFRTFALADRLGDLLVYTGYLAPDRAEAETAPALPGEAPARREVVISGGGGRVAGRLFETALAARPWTDAAAIPWRLITGPYLPEAARAALTARAEALGALDGRPAVTVETFRPDFPALLGRAVLSVSQAGYNTVLDLVRSGARAVVVPYEGSGDEQPLRARLLAARGLLHVVDERDLSPARLAAAMDTALAAPDFPAPARLDLDGAARSVELLSGLVDGVAAARAYAGPRR